MSHNDDTQEILDRLNNDVEAILSKYWSGWLRQGKRALVTPQGTGKRVTSSFVIDLEGGTRGRWYRHSKGVGGWGLALLYYGESGERGVPSNDQERADAFRYARDFLGMPAQGRQDSQEDRAAREANRAAAAAERDQQRKRDEQEKLKADLKRTLNAQQVWDGTIPLAGTQGEAYLVSRGIPALAEWPWAPDDTLRFHSHLEFEPDRDAGQFPAIVCKVVDAFGDFLAVWQIFLDRDKAVKADLMPSPKIGRGPATGGAIRIGGDGPHVDVCEGMETALGAWFLDGCRRPCWSLMSTSGMKNFEAPMFIERVNVWKDGDRAVLNKTTGDVLPPPGDNAAEALQARLKAAGIKTAINAMCRFGDALDLYNEKQKYDAHLRGERGTPAA